jgi:hypothetical protein
MPPHFIDDAASRYNGGKGIILDPGLHHAKNGALDEIVTVANRMRGYGTSRSIGKLVHTLDREHRGATSDRTRRYDAGAAEHDEARAGGAAAAAWDGEMVWLGKGGAAGWETGTAPSRRRPDSTGVAIERQENYVNLSENRTRAALLILLGHMLGAMAMR